MHIMLAELFDVTEYVFDVLLCSYGVAYIIVLDSPNASQGAMCQVVGPTCCHYIDPKGVVQIRHDRAG